MKEFIISVDSLVINFPRKDLVVKDRIMNDSLDILELIYIANLSDNNHNEKIKILSKLNMLDFYFEKSYKNKIISERICKIKCNELNRISKLVYGWIRYDSKN